MSDTSTHSLRLPKPVKAAVDTADQSWAGARGLPSKAAVPPEAVDWLPDKDRPVLAAAIGCGCDVLVTGDRTHFGAGYGRAFGGVTIYSSRSLAEQLLERD